MAEYQYFNEGPLADGTMLPAGPGNDDVDEGERLSHTDSSDLYPDADRYAKSAALQVNHGKDYGYTPLPESTAHDMGQNATEGGWQDLPGGVDPLRLPGNLKGRVR